MGEIVLNERAWVKDILAAPKLGNTPSETIDRLVRYYREEGYKKSSIPRAIDEFLLRCNPRMNISRWRDYIDVCIQRSENRCLINIKDIPITRSELDVISTLPNDSMKKLLFTLLCLAKYEHAVHPKNDGWVNMDRKRIFSLSNITTTVYKQQLLINDLKNTGYISYSKIVDNINIHVSIIDDTGEPVLNISDFRSLGNQYMNHVGGGYIKCRCCGVMVKRNNGRHLYCKSCSIDIDNTKSKEKQKAMMFGNF